MYFTWTIPSYVTVTYQQRQSTEWDLGYGRGIAFSMSFIDAVITAPVLFLLTTLCKWTTGSRILKCVVTQVLWSFTAAGLFDHNYKFRLRLAHSTSETMKIALGSIYSAEHLKNGFLSPSSTACRYTQNMLSAQAVQRTEITSLYFTT